MGSARFRWNGSSGTIKNKPKTFEMKTYYLSDNEIEHVLLISNINMICNNYCIYRSDTLENVRLMFKCTGYFVPVNVSNENITS